VTQAVDTTCATREGAHKVATLVYQQASLMIADGKRVRIRCDEAKDVRSLRQNAFAWGHVYAEISRQAVICGERWMPEAFHELFKRMFLGYRYEVVERLPGQPEISDKRQKVRRVLRSTTDLSVKQMSEYLEKVLAYGATDLGVVFETMDWQAWEQHGGRV
jgi:NinB protein